MNKKDKEIIDRLLEHMKENGHGSSALNDLVFDMCDKLGSDVNSNGVREQLEFLLDANGLTEDDILSYLSNIDFKGWSH